MTRGNPTGSASRKPAGSVYWYDKLADVEALKTLLHNGLSLTDTARRAEGFNHCTIAPWAEENRDASHQDDR